MFILAFARGDNITNENSYRRYFLPRLKIKNYNIEIDGRNFYDQSINDSIKQYDEIRKISTGQGHTAGCLLDFTYFQKNYRLIAVDLSKQKALVAGSRAVQQITFTGKLIMKLDFITFSKSRKKPFYSFQKEQQKFFN